MKKITVLIICLLTSSSAFAIKKCQDSEGKWHYGDIAVQSCENSKITTLNRRGVIKKEKAAPKSDAEKAEEDLALAEEAAAKKLVKADEAERSRVLSIYETEADIDRQRDNQLYSVQSNIDVHDSYLKNMATRIARYKVKLSEATNKKKKQKLAKDLKNSQANVKAYTKNLAKLKEQKAEILVKFEQEKELYRELTGERGS